MPVDSTESWVEAQSFDEVTTAWTTYLTIRLSWRRLKLLWKLDPELLDILARMLRAIEDARRLRGAGQLDASSEEQFTGILRSATDLRTIDAAAEGIDAMEQFLIANGDQRYLYGLAAYELSADSKVGEDGDAAGVGRGSLIMVTWSELFGSRTELEEFLAAREAGADDQVARARRKLAALARARSTSYRVQRARTRMRRRYLFSLVPLLTALVIGLAVAIELSQGEGIWRVTILAALAGAVGSTLSGVYKLRDEIRRIGELREFLPLMILQPVVGAAAGLVLLLALASASSADSSMPVSWATTGLLAFAAGFSEPFFLGTVRRVTDLGESTLTKK
jgi:hypothetical protein